jgi:predicted glycoside hydrolase/deacetylase ChbG (UPF0249 family)
MVRGLLLLWCVFTFTSEGAAPNAAEQLGYPPQTKLLMVHADDLAVSHSVDRASFAALERGDASSASIMVPCPWLTEVGEYARAHPQADLGLHLTLTSEWKTYRWGPLSGPKDVPGLLDPAGYLWPDVAGVAKNATPAQVEMEIRAQIERALKAGIRPTHLDSHMGTVLAPAFASVYVKVAREYGLPFIAFRAGVFADLLRPSDIVPDSAAIIQPGTRPENWKEFYLGLVRSLKPGLTMLIVHLGYDDAELSAISSGSATDWGSAWRQRDLEAISSPEFKQALRDNQVTLIGWKQIQQRQAKPAR